MPAASSRMGSNRSQTTYMTRMPKRPFMPEIYIEAQGKSKTKKTKKRNKTP